MRKRSHSEPNNTQLGQHKEHTPQEREHTHRVQQRVHQTSHSSQPQCYTRVCLILLSDDHSSWSVVWQVSVRVEPHCARARLRSRLRQTHAHSYPGPFRYLHPEWHILLVLRSFVSPCVLYLVRGSTSCHKHIVITFVYLMSVYMFLSSQHSHIQYRFRTFKIANSIMLGTLDLKNCSSRAVDLVLLFLC